MAEPFDLDTLQMVFAYHVVEEVVGADGEISDEELAFLQERWPREVMAERELLDSQAKPTARFESARREAIARLPTSLTPAAKLELVQLFFHAGMVDGHLDRGESEVVMRAADLLGVPVEEWMALLGESDHVGEVDLPEPEGVEGHLVMLDVASEPTVTPADAATVTPD